MGLIKRVLGGMCLILGVMALAARVLVPGLVRCTVGILLLRRPRASDRTGPQARTKNVPVLAAQEMPATPAATLAGCTCLGCTLPLLLLLGAIVVLVYAAVF